MNVGQSSSIGRAVGLFLTAALLSLVACTSSQTDEPSGQADQGGSGNAESPDARGDEASQVDETDEWTRTLGVINSAIYGSSDPVRVEIQLRDSQEIGVADCMDELGWSYEPQLVSVEQVRRDLLSTSLGSDVADDEYRLRHGYGVTEPYLGGSLQAEVGSPANAAYYEGLSSEEQNAHDQQLDECDISVREEIGLSGEVWETLNDAQEEGYAELRSDPRVAAATQEWRSCMAQNGFEYAQPRDIALDLDARATELLASAAEPAAFEGLLEEELQLAEADWQCQVDTTVASWLEVRAEIETQLIEDHPDLLDQVRAQMAQILGDAA